MRRSEERTAFSHCLCVFLVFMILLLFRNKRDIPQDKRVVTSAEAAAWAKQKKLPYIEVRYSEEKRRRGTTEEMSRPEPRTNHLPFS